MWRLAVLVVLPGASLGLRASSSFRRADEVLECGADVGVLGTYRLDEASRCTLAQEQQLEKEMGLLLDPNRDLYGRYWARKGKTIPVSKQSILSASSPHGHQGAKRRLQRVAAKLFHERAAKIAVLGGSVTAGHKSNTSWPKRLSELFDDIGYKVSVTSLAHPATTSKWAAARMSSLASTLGAADLVLVDYTVNDRDRGRWSDEGSYSGGASEVRAVFRELMSLLINLPQKPAVVALETYTTHRGRPNCSDSTTDVRTFPHWEVEEELRIPVLDFSTAVCPSGNPQWFLCLDDYEKCEKLVLEGHPGPFTHDVLARLVLGSLLLTAEGVCDTGFSGEDYPAVSTSATTECLAKPATFYAASEGEPAFAPLAHDPTWRFEEDVPGKPGWIARASEPAGEISFGVSTKTGWLQLEFLGTYEDIGSVSVWLDSSSEAMCHLSGLWSDRVSQSRFALMKVGKAGNHTLHLRSQGERFKLLGIVTC